MKNKKGAMELSINSIVIIIIAIVMLGIALIFIKTIFEKLPIPEVPDVISTQLEAMLDENPVAVLPGDLELKAGSKNEKIYLGINNLLSKSVKFCIACPNCGEPAWCADGNEEPRECSAMGVEATSSNCKAVIEVGTFGSITVNAGEKEVKIPLKVTVKPNAAKNTYLIPIHVYGSDGESSIEEVIDYYVTVT